MWLLCATGTRSVRFLRVTECVGLAAISVGISVMGRYLAANWLTVMAPGTDITDPTAAGLVRSADGYSAFAVMLGGALAFALRSALIPSPPRFTFFSSLLLGLPFVAVPLLFTPAYRYAPTLRTGGVHEYELWSYSVWWVIVTVSCTVISGVIYGLRRDVRAARRLGQYTLEEKLGEGGMGAVYRASHALLRRPTAIKLLPPDKAGPENLARFEREVQLTATLTHPNTITIYDYGRTPGGVLYYAMELVSGPTLQQVVELDGPQPPGRVVLILSRVAGALAEAHEAGLIHRDIKPSNIMLCERGGLADVVKVLDFGLVKDIRPGTDSSLTNVNTLHGTPHYLAPEAIRSPDEVSGAGDVYALGGVGYFLLTGTPVFQGENVVEVCSHQMHSAPDPPSVRLGSPIPPRLEAFLLDCLDKRPERRPRCTADLPRTIGALIDEGRWTPDDARDWWGRHAAEAWLKRSDRKPATAEATIPVDYERR
jgi:serine/threonine-protein kinase